MTDPFDIFQTETEGSVLWLEAVSTLEHAKARIQALAVRSPGEYIILNQKTGNKLIVKSDTMDGATGSNNSRYQT